MLDILGTIGGNVLSFPGILGLALGMMTRNFFVAAALGGIVGVVETFIFAKFQLENIGALELGIAIVVGVMAGIVGCAIRIKGTTAQA